MLLDPSPGIGLEDFLSRWGIDVGDDIVVDVSGVGRLFGAGPTIPLISNYPAHKITKDFNTMTFFPLARSVSPGKGGGDLPKAQTILRTNARSWAERDYDHEPFRQDKDVDLRGPVSIGVVVTKDFGEKGDSLKTSGPGEETRKTARMAVIGDSDFACNSYFSVSGNGDLFLNVVNWLAEEEDLISIRPKQKEDRRISMTVSQSRMVFYLTVIALPLLILVSGVVVRWKRR